MTDLPSNFDFHKFLNDGIKDEFSPILEGIKQTGIRAKRREDINAVLENYFKSKERKSVSAS